MEAPTAALEPAEVVAQLSRPAPPVPAAELAARLELLAR